MPANDFLVFGGGAGANVMSQADWAALAQRLSGFQSGVAQSAQLNKAWRQSSIMAAVLAQFISDQTGQDVLDDGTIATILANMKKAMPGRYLGTRVFTASGTYTPTSGTTSVIVGVIGGGGYGGASIATGAGQISVGGGGGAGGQAWSRLTSGFSGVSMTIGAGGTGGSGVGGTTSFGALLSAAGGGVGGQGPASAPPYVTINGFGGVGRSGNLYNGKGGDGACGIASSTSSFCSGGGGSSFFGCGGNGQPTGSGAGVAATTAGGGGGGALAGTSTGAFNGGNGAAGAIIIHEYA